MTDKIIYAIIDQFNSKKGTAVIESHSLGGNVSFGMVWTDKDYHELRDVSPYLFYFIRNKNGKCIGAVLDMSSDLHGYIIQAARKKGFLTNAFRQFIFPHLAQSRKEQRTSINRDLIGDENFKASLGSAIRSGFKVTAQEGPETICLIKLGSFKKIVIKPEHEGMSFERMAELRKGLNVHTVGLWHILVEVENKLGISKESRQLKRMIDELQKHRGYKLEDTLYEYLEKWRQEIVTVAI